MRMQGLLGNIFKNMTKKTTYSMWNGDHSRTKIWRTIFCLVLLSISGRSMDALAVQAPLNKRVLVLHSYYQGYKWTDDENAGIESVLKPAIGRNNLTIEYMDTKKIFGDLYSERLYEVYQLKYKNFKFHLIIVTDNNAFDFMRKYRDKLFPGTQMVFCGVNDIQEFQLKGLRLFTGVNEETDFKSTIELMLKLHPKTKQIVFVNEWTTTGVNVHEAFVKTIPHFQKSVKFLLLEDVKIEEILEQLPESPPNSLVLYTSFSRDKSGKLFEYNESISLVAQHCKVPIYTTHEFNLGYGVVGGLIVTGYDQGEAAARMALRILEGENAENIPVMMTSPKRYMFDYAQMGRFNITRTDLPADSIIINLPQTFYSKYKRWIGAVIAILVMSLLVISVLLMNIYKRKQTARELKISREQLRALAQRLAKAQERERKMISRELHDQIGQNLTVLAVNLNIMRSFFRESVPDPVEFRINDSIAIIKETTERIRLLMGDLRSPVLDDYGLIAAIDYLGKQYSQRTGINVKILANGVDKRLSASVEHTLFRIVQEALNNVTKHAYPTEVVIKLNVNEGKLYLSIKDNGRGFDTVAWTKVDGERGWGLVTMRERALAVGGTCRVESYPGLGTDVIVEVPV